LNLSPSTTICSNANACSALISAMIFFGLFLPNTVRRDVQMDEQRCGTSVSLLRFPFDYLLESAWNCFGACGPVLYRVHLDRRARVLQLVSATTPGLHHFGNLNRFRLAIDLDVSIRPTLFGVGEPDAIHSYLLHIFGEHPCLSQEAA
jgi:hypothetical protein